jgi:hypothetical protein
MPDKELKYEMSDRRRKRLTLEGTRMRANHAQTERGRKNLTMLCCVTFQTEIGFRPNG